MTIAEFQRCEEEYKRIEMNLFGNNLPKEVVNHGDVLTVRKAGGLPDYSIVSKSDCVVLLGLLKSYRKALIIMAQTADEEDVKEHLSFVLDMEWDEIVKGVVGKLNE